MGHSASKEIPLPPEGTPAYYMYRGYGPHTCQFLEKWHEYTSNYPSKAFPLEGTFEMDKILHLSWMFRGRKVSPNQWAAYMTWYEESSRRLQQAEMRSMSDSQEKLKAEMEELKRKMSVERKEGPVSPPILPSSGPEEQRVGDRGRCADPAPVGTPPLQGNPSTSKSVCLAPGQSLEAARLAWTPYELYTLASSFPDIQEDPARFKEKLRLVLACFQPAWLDVKRLLSATLPWEVQKGLYEAADWPDDEGPGWSEQRLLEAVSQACPRREDWSKIVACKQKRDEDPADFMERLKEMAQRYSGYEQHSQTLEKAVGYCFVKGLHWELSNSMLQAAPNCWELGLAPLLAIANKYWAKKQRREESLRNELRALQLQDLRSKFSRGERGRLGSRGQRNFHAVQAPSYPAITYGSY